MSSRVAAVLLGAMAFGSCGGPEGSPGLASEAARASGGAEGAAGLASEAARASGGAEGAAGLASEAARAQGAATQGIATPSVPPADIRGPAGVIDPSWSGGSRRALLVGVGRYHPGS